MTIGIGFRFAGGVLMGADTQVTYGNASKTVGSKIAHSAPRVPGYSLLIAGAGCVDSMNLFFQKLVKKLDKSKKTLQAARQCVENTLRSLYLDHIYPNRTYRNPDDGIQVLIAFRGPEGNIGFWKSEETAILDIDNEFECVGSGAHAAHFFSGPSYRPNMEAGEALVVAVDVLRQVKRFDPFCSGISEVRVLHEDGRIFEKFADPLLRIEGYLGKCERAVQKLAKDCADMALPEPAVDERLQCFCEALKTARAELENPLTKTLREFFALQPVQKIKMS
ncbi:MAG: hypothetical protein MUP80_06860 [Acidobacteriia bacterium]|nr:hypothetical protein [Terriglobia bacterium]